MSYEPIGFTCPVCQETRVNERAQHVRVPARHGKVQEFRRIVNATESRLCPDCVAQLTLDAAVINQSPIDSLSVGIDEPHTKTTVVVACHRDGTESVVFERIDREQRATR